MGVLDVGSFVSAVTGFSLCSSGVMDLTARCMAL